MFISMSMKGKDMKSVNAEIMKVFSRVKDAQSQLQSLVKSHDWVEEARRYAERQGKEVKRLFAPDVEKMKSFLERERKELAKFQKQIPGEVKKFRKFVSGQKKEFEKLLVNVTQMGSQISKKAGSSSNQASSSKKTKSTKSTKSSAGKKSKMSVPTSSGMAGTKKAESMTSSSADSFHHTPSSTSYKQ
jgi:hypothetical protein